jgi:hypothetical protein
MRYRIKRIFALALLVGLSLAGNNTKSQEPAPHGIVPLNNMPPEQWVERVWGDTDEPGKPFVIRIHNDAGYVVLPHVHPMDENITVVKGSWSLGVGRRFNRSGLEPMELGAFGYVQKNMAHFAWSKTETIVQVHGIGPFSSELVDPVYELTDKGVFLLASLLRPGRPTESSPPGCFTLKIGEGVQGDAGEGMVVGARCSPANQFTQYWVRKTNGERSWATLQELKPR